jgi:O-antigen ligase
MVSDARPAPIVAGPARVVLAPLAVLPAAVAAAVRRPSLVVAATVLLVCLPAGVQDIDASGHVTVVDLAAGVVVLVVAVRVVAGDRISTRRGWLPFAAAVGAFALATVTAADAGESLRGFVRYTELFVLIPVAVAMAVRDRRDVLLVAGAVVVTTVFEGALGVWQYTTRTGASYGGEFVRAVGTFGSGQVLALGALVGYGLLVTLALGLALRGAARIALLGTAALLALPLTLSLSRGAWIATAVAVLLMLVVFDWRIAAAITLAAVVGGLAMSAAPGSGTAGSDTFGQRATSIASAGSEPDRSVQDRYALWQTAVDIWAAHPVTGVGLKDFAAYRDSYAPLSLSAGSDVDDPTSGFRRQALMSAHNQYLMVLAEQGTVGILAFGGLLAALMAGAVRRRQPISDAGRRPLPRDAGRLLDLVAPAIMGSALVSFLYSDVGAGPTGALVAVLIGLVARRGLIVPRVAR